MEQGRPIRRWTVEPVKAPAERPAPQLPDRAPAPVRERELQPA